MPRGEKPSAGMFGAFIGGSNTSASAVSGGFEPGLNRIAAPGKPRYDPHTDPSGAGATE